MQWNASFKAKDDIWKVSTLIVLDKEGAKNQMFPILKVGCYYTNKDVKTYIR